MKVSIVYDGKCPVCSRLVAVSRLRDRADEIELVDARTDPVDNVQSRDLSAVDFDEGFAVVVDGRAYFGPDGAHMLGMLTVPSGFFYRVFQWMMATESRAHSLYPTLRAGRRVLLWMLRIPRFKD